MRLLIDITHIQQYKQFSAHTPTDRFEPYIKEAQEFDLKRAMGSPLFVELMNNLGSESIDITISVTAGTFAVSDIITGKHGTNTVATGTITGITGSVYTISQLTGYWETVNAIAHLTNTATVSKIAFGKYYKLFHGDNYSDSRDYPVIYEGIIPALVYWTYGRFLSNQKESVTPIGISVKTNQFATPASEDVVSKKVSSAFSGAKAYYDNVRKYILDMNMKVPNTFLYQNVEKAIISSGAKLSTVDRTKKLDY